MDCVFIHWSMRLDCSDDESTCNKPYVWSGIEKCQKALFLSNVVVKFSPFGASISKVSLFIDF